MRLQHWLVLLCFAGAPAYLKRSASTSGSHIVSVQEPTVADHGDEMVREESSDDHTTSTLRGWLASQQVTLAQAWPALLLATVAGLSTVIGGLVVCVMDGSPSPQAMAFALSLAAGVMVAVSFEMLFPQGHGHGHSQGHGHEGEHEEHDEGMPMWQVLACFGLGAAFCYGLSKLGDYFAQQSVALETSRDSSEEAHGDKEPQSEGRRRKESWRLAFLLFVSLTAHNVPEGFAVAISTISSQHLGLIMCVAIAMHNIPEGIAIAVSTLDATGSKMQAVKMTFYSGLSEPAGALLALLLLQTMLTPAVITILMTVVAGIMSYIAFVELLPEAHKKNAPSWAVSGFLSGIAVMVITHEVMHHLVEEHG